MLGVHFPSPSAQENVHGSVPPSLMHDNFTLQTTQTGEMLSNLWYIQVVQCYRATRWNKRLTYKWEVSLKDVLSERIPLIWYSKQTNKQTTVTESRSVIAWYWGASGRLSGKRYRGTFWNYAPILYLDCGRSYTVAWICLNSPICTLKMGAFY